MGVSHSRPIQLVAGVLVLTLVLLPVGTAVASCLGDSEPSASDASAAAPGTVIEAVSHHCPHDVDATEYDSAVRAETILRGMSVDASSPSPPFTAELFEALSRPSPTDRAVQALSDPPQTVLSSLRTVVLRV